MSNFYAELAAVAAQHADRDCLGLPDGTAWRYADMTQAVDQLACVLLDKGVSAGERVVVQVDKSPHNLALYLATLKVGGVYVPLNTAYTAAELDYFLGDAEPQLFVGREMREDVACLTLVSDPDGQSSGGLVDAMAAFEGQAAPTVARGADELAAIVYTSGTTGRSKGAMLSHGNLSSNAHNLSKAWGWRDDDVLLHALPIFHVHGLFIASHCALLSGTPMEWLARFDAAVVNETLARCTVMMGVPTFYTRLLALDAFPAQPLAHMRVFICGSAPLTEQVFDAWADRTGHRILERYGMSETIINTTNPLHGERVPATVGFPLPELEVRIAKDDGTALPTGEVGTIEVRGPNGTSWWRRVSR